MFFGGKEFILFEGVVEDRNDPLCIGRVRVRVIGFHDEDKQKIPTDTLPWAIPLLPPDAGRNVVGYKEGDFVAGYFRDGESRQFPVILGMIPGIPEAASDPERGYSDPTPDEDLVPGKVPRPPEMIPPNLGCSGSEAEQSLSSLRWSDLSEEQKEALLDAQARAEGATRPGTLPNRMNNPGAMVYAPWQEKYGGVPGQRVGKRVFAKFPTMADGRRAQRALWESKAYKDKSLRAGLTKWVDPDDKKAFANYSAQIYKGISSAGPVPFASATSCIDEGTEMPIGKYDNPNKLPVEIPALGQLTSQFGTIPFPYDLNKDGKYDLSDASLILDPDQDGKIGFGILDGLLFFGQRKGLLELPKVPISRYPLENQLKEAISSRLARNEKIEQTLVNRKKGGILSAPTATHTAIGVGTDKPYEGGTITEPETPYDAKYPYNHVYESESGHVIEYDDTPLVERIHTYHRSGTFREIHPDGIQVDKSVGDRYDLSLKDSNIQAEENINITAKEILRALGQHEVTLESGDVMNQDCGGDRNILVGGNANTKIKENVYTVIDGDVRILIKGNLNVAVEGDIKIKADGSVLVDGSQTRIAATYQNVIRAGLQVITEGPETYLGSMITGGPAVHATFADTAGVAYIGTPVPLPPAPPAISFIQTNDADNMDNVNTVRMKEGYVLNDDSILRGSVMVGDLYKSASDSDGNAVVLTKRLGQIAKFYEALPADGLEDATVQYKHKDGSVTDWQVKRPSHKKGRLIEIGKYGGNGNGGRDHWRFSKPGSEYPSSMILEIGDTEYLLVESVMRHEAL